MKEFDGSCINCNSTRLVELAGGILECMDCGIMFDPEEIDNVYRW